MIQVDTKDLEKSLQAYKEEVQRKLTAMVQKFAQRIVEYAVVNTPLGDSTQYAKLYQQRTYLPQKEGIAQGNWQFSRTSTGVLQFVSGTDAGSKAVNMVASESSSYKLGESFYITNAAPYIGELQNNHSDQTKGVGILKPTADNIARTYKMDLKQYYDQG